MTEQQVADNGAEMPAKDIENQLELERDDLVQRALDDRGVAAAIATFDAVSGLLPAPRLVSTAEIRFDTTTNL